MFDAADLAEAARILERCRGRRIRIATAESCTGGLIGGLLTAIAGSSDVIDCGFVTYSNEAKTAMLGVPADLIRREGAVSDAVARAMAEGALARSRADLTVAVTGIAGPGGGSAERPVGLVYMATAMSGSDTTVERHVFPGDRAEVRHATVRAACRLLLTTLARSAAA